MWNRLYGTYVHVDANEEIALGVREYVGLAPLAVLGRSLGEPFTPLRKTAPLATPFAPEHESASVSSSGNAGPAR